MALAPSSHLYTPEEFLELEDSVAYELYDGELVERPVSRTSSGVGLALGALLFVHAKTHGLGKVYGPDLGLQLFTHRPRRIPRADVVFVSFDTLPAGAPDTGFLEVVPELVAEVSSPGNMANEMERKVTEYLSAGVRLVWVVYPETQHIHVFRADGTASVLTATSTLSGEDVIPAFECPVASLFDS